MQSLLKVSNQGKSGRPRVLVIEPWIKHYRVPFFTQLHSALSYEGIDLVVAYSKPNSEHAIRQDNVDLQAAWALKVNAYWVTNRLLYQPLWKQIARADLVIVRSEVKHMINYPLLILSALRIKTVAYWGLGPNMHPDRVAASEWIKERLFNKADWYFAYTPSVVDYLKKIRMPVEKITNVQNATDTTELRRLIDSLPDADITQAKYELTGAHDSRIGLYCGLLHMVKSLPLLLDAARLVKQQCPQFHLVLIGNGPDRPWLENAIAHEPWIHYLGSKYGRESALYYKMADAFLLAGTAGLAIVDSFAAGLPLLATRLSTHPPEISYVINDVNGRLASHDANAFAASILEVLMSPDLMAKLRDGARESGSRYTMEAMVLNFSTGIKKCLEHYGRYQSRAAFEVISTSE
jgi:glycosyltransferase involved in cell wall biosynthesis